MRSRPHMLAMVGTLAVLATAGAVPAPRAQAEPEPRPPPPKPPTGHTYHGKPPTNGNREVARRLRQQERALEKAARREHRRRV